jgi:putative oxidoreductase
MQLFSAWLNDNKDIGVFLLRLFIGIRLIYGVIDNIFSWERMLQFQAFLQKFNFPFPLISAVLSVYAQAIAGIMILLGFKIRVVAILMIINFLVALIMVHRNDTLEGMTPALAILFSSLLFLFQGAGNISLEKSSIKSQ